jgi:hypothetical protein
MKKVKVFEKELKYISDSKIKEFISNVIENLPEYFFKIPASSTGKYHPNYALGDEGLVRHTKAAVGIAVELFRVNNMFTKEEQDLIVGALIIHDGLKNGRGQSKYTVHEHPNLIADFVKEKNEELKLLTEEQITNLMSMLKTHMGQWTTNNYSDIVLQEPKTKLDRFAHMCDYLASRKCLEFNFNI